MSKSVKEELLIHDPKDIFRLNGRLAIVNRKLVVNDPEAEDKLAYYDKVGEFIEDYQPITYYKNEQKDDEAEDAEMEDVGIEEDLNKKNKYDMNESSMQLNVNNNESKNYNIEDIKQDDNEANDPMDVKISDRIESEIDNQDPFSNKSYILSINQIVYMTFNR